MVYGRRKSAEINITHPIPKIPNRGINIGDSPAIMIMVIKNPLAAQLALPDPIRALPNNVEYP